MTRTRDEIQSELTAALQQQRYAPGDIRSASARLIEIRATLRRARERSRKLNQQVRALRAELRTVKP